MRAQVAGCAASTSGAPGHYTASMRVSVIGCGYLGAVHAACMAALGHEVVGLDVDSAKIALLADGVAPFHEPGFDEVLLREVESGRLTFSTDPATIADADIHFIGVGTPQLPGGSAPT